MRKALLFFALLPLCAPASAQYDGLIISEVAHGTNRPGFQPKYVELYNAASDPIPLGGLAIRLYSNGNASFRQLPLGDAVLAPGEAFVAANSNNDSTGWNPDWGAAFETPPDTTGFRVINGNGNDVYELYDTEAGRPIDVYGDIDDVADRTDFSADWSYRQKRVTRQPASNDGNDGDFDLSEWAVEAYTNSGATPGNHVATPLGELPVELVAFEALGDGGGAALLRWRTASEEHNAGFHVEHRPLAEGARTSEPAPFVALGFAEGHGTTSEPQRYAFRAEGLEPGRHAFRLRQVDFDGTASYSPTVEVEVAPELPGGYLLSAAHPNPFSAATRFTLRLAREQHVRVEVFNVLGQRVRLLHDGPLEAGEPHAFAFEGDGLPSGLYLYRAQGERFVTSGQITLLK